jgi:hypothetical protein
VSVRVLRRARSRTKAAAPSSVCGVGRLELRPEEAEALRVLLDAVTVSENGEVGVIHAGRFESSRYGVRREHLAVLDGLARKVGISSGVRKA